MRRLFVLVDESTRPPGVALAGHDLACGQTIDFLTELALGVHAFAVAATDDVGNASSFTD